MTNDIQFDPAKPVRTRDGRAARIICTDAKNTYPIIALVADSGEEELVSYSSTGKFWGGELKVHDLDIINVPEQRHHWYNVYEPGSAGNHYTRSKADESATPGRIAVLHLIFENGKLVSSEVEHV